MYSPRTYTLNSISSMNSTNLWRNSIKTPDTCVKKNEWGSEPLYNLHPTGDCDLNGRKYVALPVGTDTSDPRVREKYNLI
jgi:hypothetical protein